MMIIVKKLTLLLNLFLIVFLSGCAQKTGNNIGHLNEPVDDTAQQKETAQHSDAQEILQENIPKSTPVVTDANKEEIKNQVYSIWISDLVPQKIVSEILAGENIRETDTKPDSDISLEMEVLLDAPLAGKLITNFTWVYSLTSAFPVLLDDVDSSVLIDVWKGEAADKFAAYHFLLAESTYQIFLKLWGRPAKNSVTILPAEDLLDAAWENQNSWAIIPFEQISPRWKVISVDGISPIHNDYSGKDYALEVDFILTTQKDEIPISILRPNILVSNRDSERFTSLVMTGTTALVRYTAQRMEVNGVDYPAQDILDWLLDADLTHISNEVSFYENCPPADPVRREQRFCSSPDYYELFEYIDVDIVELTGNHILDWGDEPFLYTLDLYKEKSLPYFGGGENLAEARQPLLIEHNGNQLYFIGCSPAGPENVWATDESAGSNPCESEWMQTQINFANQNGYIPIVTFQHWEVEDYKPHSSQRVDFLNAAKMGAVIVSGSQSHFPQSMTLYGDTFIHFGLGNLFFDQMYGDNLREFIDRHVFYDGNYINTELLTAMLEDYAKPRPMTDSERTEFLEEVFGVCNWEMQE